MSVIDFDAHVQGLKSKSEKIRALAQHGVSTADIARYLNIRYQHARNVLVQSGLHRTRSESPPETGLKPLATRPAAASVKSAWIEVDGAGRLSLPDALLAAADIGIGDQVHVTVLGDVIEIRSKAAALRHAQEIVSEFVPPGVSLVDELIAERRREAGDEMDRTGG
jgi:antitoxin component of MazEF toxin-antitoxin module